MVRIIKSICISPDADKYLAVIKDRHKQKGVKYKLSAEVDKMIREVYKNGNTKNKQKDSGEKTKEV